MPATRSRCAPRLNARLTARLAPAALAALLACAGSPAQAVGALADLTVVDRDTGQTLPLYRHAGRLYLAGQPGTRYAIALRNQTGARVMTVISVDGVNVVSGETAGWMQTGYVLDAGRSYEIAGWRKNDREVAAFEFTALGDSYAARTGRPANVGAIGLAVFRERPAPLPMPASPPVAAEAPYRDAAGGKDGPRAQAPHSTAAASDAPGEARGTGSAASKAQSEASVDRAAPAPAARLGTGHGARETSVVGRTTFERRRDHPDETVTLYYDSRENLVAMGVIPSPAHAAWPRPLPFPNAGSGGFVPDPPVN